MLVVISPLVPEPVWNVTGDALVIQKKKTLVIK